MRALERTALRGIAGITAATGAAQVVAPRTVLHALRGDESAATRHFFGTVGMFMACTGGIQLARPDEPAVALMTAGQKLGAAAGVSLAVRRGLLARTALAVAGFDALTAVLALDYWRRVR